jgi:hypothetical protein
MKTENDKQHNGLAVDLPRLVLSWFLADSRVPRWELILMWFALLCCFWRLNFSSINQGESQTREHHTPIVNPSE